MSSQATQGTLITFEGLGGSGKSTIIARLASCLAKLGAEVVTTREPGGTDLGTQLRSWLLEGKHLPVPWTEAFLFEADRAQTYAEVILPALAQGKVVISDRNLYGTIAYQAFGRGLDLDLVDRMSAAATSGRMPDLIFVLDIDPAVGLQRKHGQGAVDRFDDENLAYQHRVREGYLFAARRDADRAQVLDAGQAADVTFAAVWQTVADHLADHLHTRTQ